MGLVSKSLQLAAAHERLDDAVDEHVRHLRLEEAAEDRVCELGGESGFLCHPREHAEGRYQTSTDGDGRATVRLSGEDRPRASGSSSPGRPGLRTLLRANAVL